MSFALVQLDAREQAPLAGESFARWRNEDGELTASFHRCGDGYQIRFPERADFYVSLAERTVSCRPFPDVSELAVRDLYLNQVLPMIRAHEGELIIHASAVAGNSGALCFVGATGRGKSTLAAAFAKASQPFLSDDGIVLALDGSRYVASPNRPSFRLWPDSQLALGAMDEATNAFEGEKSRVEASTALPFHDAPLPLRALYFLGRGTCAVPVIEPLPSRRAAAELMNHTFLLDAADRERLQRHFETLADLAEAVACFALDYPRDYALLPSVIEAVVRHDSRRGPAL